MAAAAILKIEKLSYLSIGLRLVYGLGIGLGVTVRDC